MSGKGNPKGVTGNRNGRPKGIPNKATIGAREAIALFVDGNAERLNGWLDAIAADSPKDAFDCFMKVVDYHIPRLQRTIVAGDPNAPLESQVTVGHFLGVLPEGTKLKLREALEKNPQLLDGEFKLVEKQD